jgi:hypothetical protein
MHLPDRQELTIEITIEELLKFAFIIVPIILIICAIVEAA